MWVWCHPSPNLPVTWVLLAAVLSHRSPITTCTSWWCRQFDELKCQVRPCERTQRRYRADDHRCPYTDLRDQYCRTLASTISVFYRKEIESASNVNRAMFRIAKYLLSPKVCELSTHRHWRLCCSCYSWNSPAKYSCAQGQVYCIQSAS